MAFKSKADLAFGKKAKIALDNRDWNQIAHLFYLYGCYLELVEPLSVDIAQPDEPTTHEEQQHVFTGGHVEFCIRTLHRDPITLQPLTEAQLAEHGLVK